jgi:ADP-ribosyl-[dinitrogen reductase] hydrolase
LESSLIRCHSAGAGIQAGTAKGGGSGHRVSLPFCVLVVVATLEASMSEPRQTTVIDTAERFRGCLVGLIAGECLGAPLEGLSPAVIKRLHDEITEIRGGGFLGIQPGQYGRNGEAALCVINSLVQLSRFDMDDVVARWLEWKRSGFRGMGATTSDALERIEKGTQWRDAGRKVAQSQTAGNGAMARVAPIALFFLNDRPSLIQHATELSMATHGHPEALGAAVATAVLIAELCDGANVVEAVEVAAATARARDEAVIAGCVRGSARKELRDLGTSTYCLHTLETSTWCLARTNSFEEALVTAANLGGDACGHGAVTGALAGAYYGHAAIPERWTSVVQAHQRLVDGADALHRLLFPRGTSA